MTNNALAGALIAVLVILPAGGVAAQSETSKPAGMKVEQGKPAAQAQAAPGESKPVKTASGRRVEHMFDDARHCLDQPSIAEIIKCAEPYRY